MEISSSKLCRHLVPVQRPLTSAEKSDVNLALGCPGSKFN